MNVFSKILEKKLFTGTYWTGLQAKLSCNSGKWMETEDEVETGHFKDNRPSH